MFERPPDEQYWIKPWSTVLFAGDLFIAIPFGHQPTELYKTDEGEGGRGQHFQAAVDFAYGLLISPTCDMYESIGAEIRRSHPYRVLVPVVPLERVAAETKATADNVKLMRKHDALYGYVYLPELRGAFPESAACLFRPTVVSDDFLSEPPRRIAQLHPEARRHLKIKLMAYWGRKKVKKGDIELFERGEEEVKGSRWPPSQYDYDDGLEF